MKKLLYDVLEAKHSLRRRKDKTAVKRFLHALRRFNQGIITSDAIPGDWRAWDEVILDTELIEPYKYVRVFRDRHGYEVLLLKTGDIYRTDGQPFSEHTVTLKIGNVCEMYGREVALQTWLRKDEYGIQYWDIRYLRTCIDAYKKELRKRGFRGVHRDTLPKDMQEFIYNLIN